MRAATHAETMDAIERACRELHLDSLFVSSVYAYLQEPEARWPRCCGMTCAPCVLDLAAVARRARAILNERKGEGSPAR